MTEALHQIAEAIGIDETAVVDHAVVLAEGIAADGTEALWVVRLEAGCLNDSLRLLAAAQLAWLDPDADEEAEPTTREDPR